MSHLCRVVPSGMASVALPSPTKTFPALMITLPSVSSVMPSPFTVTVEGDDEPLNVTTIFLASSSKTTLPMLVTGVVGVAEDDGAVHVADLETEDDLVALVRREEDAGRAAARSGDRGPQRVVVRVGELVTLQPDAPDLLRVLHIDDRAEIEAIVSLIQFIGSHRRPRVCQRNTTAT